MKKRRLIIILLSTLCLSQCVSMVRYGVKDGQNLPADFVTQQKIDAALAFSDMELFSQIDINVYEGNVLLTGRSPSQEATAQLLKILKKINGINKVHNHLSEGVVRTPSEYSQDKWIGTQASSLMLLNGYVFPSKYVIEVMHKVVYVLGRAPNEAEKQEVLDILRRIEGVKKVVSHIAVGKLPIKY